MSTHYFAADCPICEHRLRLCYAYTEDEGPHSPGIVDGGACNCFLGEDWLEQALEAYLDCEYEPEIGD